MKSLDFYRLWAGKRKRGEVEEREPVIFKVQKKEIIKNEQGVRART